MFSFTNLKIYLFCWLWRLALTKSVSFSKWKSISLSCLRFYQSYWCCFPSFFKGGKIIETSILQIKYHMQNITVHTYLTMDLYNTYTYEHKNYIYNNLLYNVILHHYMVGLKSNGVYHQCGGRSHFKSIPFH